MLSVNKTNTFLFLLILAFLLQKGESMLSDIEEIPENIHSYFSQGFSIGEILGLLAIIYNCY